MILRQNYKLTEIVGVIVSVSVRKFAKISEVYIVDLK